MNTLSLWGKWQEPTEAKQAQSVLLLKADIPNGVLLSASIQTQGTISWRSAAQAHWRELTLYLSKLAHLALHGGQSRSRRLHSPPLPTPGKEADAKRSKAASDSGRDRSERRGTAREATMGRRAVARRRLEEKGAGTAVVMTTPKGAGGREAGQREPQREGRNFKSQPSTHGRLPS